MRPRIKVTINGQVCTGRAGQTLLEIAEHNGIAIPNLCHNGELKHYGGCSLCVVEAEGSPKLLRACSTEAQDGQVNLYGVRAGGAHPQNQHRTADERPRRRLPRPLCP